MADDPQTDEEWQVAADMAYGGMLLDSARKYGLVSGGPEIDVDRCAEILVAARQRGITPRDDAPERFVAAMASEGVT